MALQEILDRQATSLEYVLHTHGIRARVDGGRLSPRLAHFHIMLPPGVRPNVLAPLVPELAEALGVAACRLAPDAEGGVGVYLEVPRPDPVPVRLLPLVQRVADVVPPITATLGVDTEATPLLLRLNAPDVDPVLVSGGQGVGKSRLLRGMALSLALHNSPDNLRLLLLEATGDGVAFKGMDSLPHLACPVANGPVDVLVSLRWALRTLARRDASAGDADDYDGSDMDSGELFSDEEYTPRFRRNEARMSEPALVIMLDGADKLLLSANRRAGAEAADALNRLLRSGSANGIHLVVSSERPDLGLNADWGARIAGVTLSAEMARMATGVKGSGAQALLGSGDFLIALNAELIRFQAAAASGADVGKAVDLINSWTNAPRAGETAQTEAVGMSRQREHTRAEQEPIPLRRVWAGE